MLLVFLGLQCSRACRRRYCSVEAKQPMQSSPPGGIGWFMVFGSYLYCYICGHVAVCWDLHAAV